MFKPTHTEHELGEKNQLGLEEVVRFVLADNGILEIAIHHLVEIVFSVDAAGLTNGTTHIFAACKSVDQRSNKNGKLLFVKVEEDGSTSYQSLQSNKTIYLMQMVYSADGKLLYQHFLKIGLCSLIGLKKGLP